MADIVQMCTNSGTLNAAATCVATVPPKPGMTRTANRKPGETTLKRVTHPGSRAIYLSRSSRWHVLRATA